MAKSPKIVKVNMFFSILALNHLVASIPSQNHQFLRKKASFCQWPKWNLMTFTENSRKNNKIVKVNPFLSLSAFKHQLASTPTIRKSVFAKNCKYLMVTKELTSMTRSQNVGKTTQFRQSDHILGSFCHQVSSCILTYSKRFKVCRKKLKFFRWTKWTSFDDSIPK